MNSTVQSRRAHETAIPRQKSRSTTRSTSLRALAVAAHLERTRGRDGTRRGHPDKAE